jgi:uncharacterized membrane protein
LTPSIRRISLGGDSRAKESPGVPLIRKSIHISASPEDVFNYVTNTSTQPDWISFIREVEITSGDGKSEGTTDRCLFKLGPRAQTLDAVWTEYDPPRAFAREATSGLEMEGRMTFDLRDDGTHVEWTMSYEPPMGPLGALLDALFMNRVFQNEMEESLESLKARLEG